jgi:Tfp pilus assembly pilus retraction ATPase PilT
MTNDDKEKESPPAAATPEKTTTTNPSSPDLSPNAIVQAAAANAMQQQQEKKQQQNKEDDHSMEADTTTKKRPRYYEDDYLQPMEDIWSHQQKKGNREEAIKETWKLMTKYVDELIQDGIFAHQECERFQQKLKVAEEDSAAKTRELGRLRVSDQKARESIAVSIVIVFGTRRRPMIRVLCRCIPTMPRLSSSTLFLLEFVTRRRNFE